MSTDRSQSSPTVPSAVLVGLALVTMIASLYATLIYVPTDRLQGDVQRLFYLHVPAALTMYLAILLVFIASLRYLQSRDARWDEVATAGGEMGVLFGTIVMITGPLWAKPIWGAWWTWDARLTSTLLLWLIYLSYMLLRGFLEEPARRATLAAVFGIFGFATVPFVFMTIRLWRTQHPQPVLMGGEGSGLDPVMFQALMVSWAAFLILFVFLATLRVRLEKDRDQVRQLRRELMVQ